MTNSSEDRIRYIGESNCRLSDNDYATFIFKIAEKNYDVDEYDVRALIRLISNLFKVLVWVQDMKRGKLKH